MSEDSSSQGVSMSRLIRQVVVIWTVNGFMAGFLFGIGVMLLDEWVG